MAQNFIKHKENFKCEYCGESAIGNGYTNHCPQCLWSKHVDVSPGDRASRCGGLMEPISLNKVGEEFILAHRCLNCGHEKQNKTATNDDLSTYLAGML